MQTWTATPEISSPILAAGSQQRARRDRAMWAAEGEAAIRTVVDNARLTGRSPFGTILKTVSA